MQKQTDNMMAGGVVSEQAPIQYMRNHSQRDPVAYNNGCKSPFYSLKIYSRMNMMISGNVSVVIEVNKIITRYTTEGGKAGDHKQYYNGEKNFFIDG